MSRPNVLILLTDQQRFDTLCCAGYPHMITPNLDRLAAEGMLCENAYSGNPVCMPARHDLITGYPARMHGYYANAEKKRIKDYAVPTLPRVMADNGYRTVAVGKMHFSPPREHHGFGEMYLMEELPKNRQDDQYATFLQEEGLGDVQNLHGVRPHIYHFPQNAQMDEAHHGTTWVANRAIQWLEENGNAPFMMMCGFIHPHPPWDIPAEMDGLYEGRELPKPVPRSRTPLDGNEPRAWFGDFDSPELVRKTQEAYFTSVTMVDKQAGRILEYLRTNGKLDDTLVIFTTDHGEMLYDKGYFSKEIPYEGAAHIPMIVRYPARVPAGARRQEFADLLDIFPTCMDACGIDYSGYTRPLYGESLLAQAQKKDRTYQISATGMGKRRWVMVRDSRYKYVYNYNGAYEELYDLCSPEGEQVNLIENGTTPDLARFRKQALCYEAQWGPEECVQDGKLISVPFAPFTPDVRGKFHLWSNVQTQKFFAKDDPAKRGDRLREEMIHAMANAQKSGCALEDVFGDPAWKEHFAANWRLYNEDESAPLDWLFAPDCPENTKA